MSKSGQVVMFEKHPCPHCHNYILMLDAEELSKLSPVEQIIQKALGVFIIKPGDAIICPFCHKQFVV